MIAVVGGKSLWYATRGTGIVTLLLLTVSLVIGIVTSVRFETREWPRVVIAAMHRNISLVAVVFVTLHVVTTVQDSFAPIHYLDALIPFRSPYRTVWLGLGAVAVDLLLALIITSVVRARLGYRTWRAVHWIAYACWPIAFMHALGTGSDARDGWMVVLGALMFASVVASIVWRFAAVHRPAGAAAWAAGATAIVVAVAIPLWALGGPLQAGWAHTSHPVTRAAVVRTTVPPSAASDAAEAQGFTASFDGTRRLGTVASDGRVTITIAGALSTRTPLRLEIELHGIAVGDGVSLQIGDVHLGPPGTHRWNGHVDALVGSHIDALVTNAKGAHLALSMDLAIDRGAGTVTGTVTARPTSGGRG
jgi:methionine sulfoxide reductase heme-binding subunit